MTRFKAIVFCYNFPVYRSGRHRFLHIARGQGGCSMRIVDDTGKALLASARSYFERCMNEAKWKFKFLLLQNGDEDIFVVWCNSATHPDVRKRFRDCNRKWIHADSGYLLGWVADYELPPSSRKGHPAVALTPELLAKRERLIPLLRQSLISAEREEKSAG